MRDSLSLFTHGEFRRYEIDSVHLSRFTNGEFGTLIIDGNVIFYGTNF